MNQPEITKQICSDGLNTQIEEYLKLNRIGRTTMWVYDGRFFDGTQLFGFCGIGHNVGCPTMVKSGNYVACTPEITKMIHESDLPESDVVGATAPVNLTREQLERIKAIQLAVYEEESKRQKKGEK